MWHCGPDAFSLQKLEETLGYRIAVAVSASARIGIEAVLAEEGLPFPAGELGALVGMDQDGLFWFAPPDSHQKSSERQVRRYAGIAQTSRRQGARTGPSRRRDTASFHASSDR